jgi:membrane-associated phospholipid phosphatase
LIRIIAHVRSLWGPFWVLPGGLPGLYVLVVAGLGDLRIDHIAVVLLSCTLAYFGEHTKRFFLDVLPYLVVAVGYDAMRYPLRLVVTPGRVIGCELRELELALFPAAPGMTFQDWFATHHGPVLDLLFAAPYMIFLYVVFGYAIFLYFVDRSRMRRFLWAFAAANLIAFVIWLSLPAAPPWYIREHGCVIDTATPPSAAALLRADALLSTDYFRAFYSRGSQVFGALPSLHCAYPVLGLLTAWNAARYKTRSVHLAYALWMAVAAVYLDHHWVIDVIGGWLLAAVAVWIAGRLVDRWERTGPSWIRRTETGGTATEAAPEPVPGQSGQEQTA